MADLPMAGIRKGLHIYPSGEEWTENEIWMVIGENMVSEFAIERFLVFLAEHPGPDPGVYYDESNGPRPDVPLASSGKNSPLVCKDAGLLWLQNGPGPKRIRALGRASVGYGEAITLTGWLTW